MNPNCRALVLVATLVAAAACSPSGGAKADPKAAPDFTLKDIKGQRVALTGLKGQVVLLDFWATWCEPCKESIPVLETLHKRYDGKGLVILGINEDGGDEGVAEFARKMRMTYPVLLDIEMDVMQAYKVRGIPNLFLLDKQGRIRKHYVGIDDNLHHELDTEIQKLIEEKT